MTETNPVPTPGPAPAPAPPPVGVAHPETEPHPHHLRLEERLERLERRGDLLAVLLVIVLGVAMLIGLAFATGRADLSFHAVAHAGK